MTAFRFTTAGESHGPGLVAIVEGLPAGLELDRDRPRSRTWRLPAPERP
jgi:chorismate synthase